MPGFSDTIKKGFAVLIKRVARFAKTGITGSYKKKRLEPP